MLIIFTNHKQSLIVRSNNVTYLSAGVPVSVYQSLKLRSINATLLDIEAKALYQMSQSLIIRSLLNPVSLFISFCPKRL